METKLLCLAVLILASCPLDAAVISNRLLRVAMSDDNGTLAVTDLRTKQTWRQAWVEDNPACRQRIASVDEAQRQLVIECGMAGITHDGKKDVATFRLSVKLHATRPDLEFTFAFAGQGQWRQAAYPYVFARDGAGVRNLYPHGEGMLVPVRKSDPDWLALPDGDLYGGVHSYLMCLGLVDEPTGQGLLTLLPDFEATLVHWRDVPVDGQTIVAPQYICRSNRETFDRPWRMTFSFSDQGGYVALAKRYREFFAAAGLHKTLREKAAVNPAVADIAGAPIFWAAARLPKEASNMADVLKATGVDRCLFAMCNVPWRKPDEPEYQKEMAAAIHHVRSLGYQVYRYDQYRDAFEPDPTKPHSHQINTNAWPDKIVRRPDGSMVAAFGPGSGVICSRFFMPLAREAFDREFGEFEYSAWFLDCLGSVGFNAESECYASSHPCDRYDTRRQREALLAEVNRRGKLAGTECGLDYLIPYVHWYEGATTLVNWVSTAPSDAAGVFRDINSESNRKAHTKDLLKELSGLALDATAPSTISQSVKYRIPFYSLCHHDEVIVTWRWEDGMDQPPVYWARKNLWSVLYGAPPMYRMFAPGQAQWQAQISQTHRYVSDWVRQVALEAMVSHRFLTTDRTVQESEFSGGRGILVNFGDKEYRLADGQVVNPCGYVIFRRAGDKRSYTLPSGPNVSKKSPTIAK
jgi:hypothetical protein